MNMKKIITKVASLMGTLPESQVFEKVGEDVGVSPSIVEKVFQTHLIAEYVRVDRKNNPLLRRG
jgi:hypothetical protein